jgi:ribosomal-protein-alanine N-acetyltransferase
MSKVILLRDYRTTDLDAMIRLDNACFTEEFRFDQESMREFAEERNAIVYVAEGSDGEIAGFVIVHIELVAAGVRGYVVTLDVAGEYRLEGVASRLMLEAERQAGVIGALWMDLDVFTRNEGAIRFYERLGYERVGVKRRFYGRAGLDAFGYRKRLA